MTKQSVVVSDAGALAKPSINMTITLTVSNSSLFTYAPMPSSPRQKFPSGGFIAVSEKNLWKKAETGGGRINPRMDSMKASSPTHNKSPVPFSAVAEDPRSWIVSFYNITTSFGLVELEFFDKIVIRKPMGNE